MTDAAVAMPITAPIERLASDTIRLERTLDASPEKVWANPALQERHDVDTVVAVNP